MPATTRKQPPVDIQPATLTVEQLDHLAYEIPHVKAWVKAVEARIELALDHGVELKNVSLVPTRATRKWGPTIDILATLRKFSKLDVVAPRVPLSPAQAEKTLGKKLFAEKLAEFTVRESSGTKLAYVYDEIETEKDI